MQPAAIRFLLTFGGGETEAHLAAVDEGFVAVNMAETGRISLKQLQRQTRFLSRTGERQVAGVGARRKNRRGTAVLGRLFFVPGSLHDLRETAGIETGAADKGAIDICL